MQTFKDFLLESDEPKLKLFDRPEGEYPVYELKIGNKSFYIQKSDTNSGSYWYQVEQDKDKYWMEVVNFPGRGKEQYQMIGDNKKEAVDWLLHKYSK